MSFMFHNDQWDDNWDQYKVDLENENKRTEIPITALYIELCSKIKVDKR